MTTPRGTQGHLTTADVRSGAGTLGLGAIVDATPVDKGLLKGSDETHLERG